jgi:hypothetical protein
MQAATGEILSSGDPEQITFAVTQVWKGPVYTTLVVTTARESATCGFPFELNKDYLVYATGSETALETSLCSRTRPLDVPTIQQDLDTLGQGKVPTSAPPANLLPSPIVSSTAVPIVTSSITTPPTEPTKVIAIQSEGQSKSTLPLVQIMLITLVGIGLIIGIVVAIRHR